MVNITTTYTFGSFFNRSDRDGTSSLLKSPLFEKNNINPFDGVNTTDIGGLLGRLSKIEDQITSLSQGEKQPTIEDILAQTNLVSSQLRGDKTQTLFAPKSDEKPLTVADTLLQFKGMLKVFEQQLDAIFIKPKLF